MDDSLEVWKVIDNFPHYEVSNKGRIRSWYKRGGRGESAESPRQLNPTRGKDGYFRVWLLKNKKSHGRLLHRLVLESFVGPCPQGMEACHNDGDKQDNQLQNLRWDTPANNSQDKIEHGTHNRGERSGHSKLTEGDVLKIVEMRKCGMYHKDIAKKFNVGAGCIIKVCNGITWSHLTGIKNG